MLPKLHVPRKLKGARFLRRVADTRRGFLSNGHRKRGDPRRDPISRRPKFEARPRKGEMENFLTPCQAMLTMVHGSRCTHTHDCSRGRAENLETLTPQSQPNGANT